MTFQLDAGQDWPLLAHVSGRPDKVGSKLVRLLLTGTIPTSADPARQAGRTSGSVETRDIERIVWGHDSHFVYFYAGRWIPRYGDFGLGYSGAPEFEGSASPWDSGARFRCLKAEHGDEEAALMIRAAEIPASAWRTAFAEHFKKNPDYFNDSNTNPDVLFEVRRTTPHPIAEGLEMWDGSSDTVKAFRSLYARGGLGGRTFDSSLLAAFHKRLLVGVRGASWAERLHRAQEQRQSRTAKENL